MKKKKIAEGSRSMPGTLESLHLMELGQGGEETEFTTTA